MGFSYRNVKITHDLLLSFDFEEKVAFQAITNIQSATMQGFYMNIKNSPNMIYIFKAGQPEKGTRRIGKTLSYAHKGNVGAIVTVI